MKNFEFEDWRKRYLRWMHHNKARIMDFFRRQDKDRDGRVTRKEFIEGIIMSKFPTSRPEMEAVADIFDRDGDGYINYKEFVAALRPPDKDVKPETDSEKIQDEVKRQVSKCTCVKQFKIHKIGEGKYRFGESQKLRLVRILRSTVMVRVGGGWVALDEFLVKNDPCRVGLWRRKQFRLKRRYLEQQQQKQLQQQQLEQQQASEGSEDGSAKGRTNTELRENFVLAQGVSQSMSGFVSKSPAGSSSSSSYSGRSNSTSMGPITKIREKTSHGTPWRQKTRTTPDGEVHEIMSHTQPDGTRITKHRHTHTHDLRSPRNIASPSATSRSSSRASLGNGSRPASRAGSEASDEPEVYTTVHRETKNAGGRSNTTLTYQTHTIQTKNVTLPTVTTTKISRIPKITPTKKK